MKYLRLFESFEDIDEICRKYNIKNYTINSDGSIYANAGGVGSLLYFCLSEKKLTKLPLKFNKVLGIFDCSWNELTTLKGSPIELNAFDCHENEDTDEPAIVMDRLNDFLLTIGKDTVEKVDRYKNI